MAKKSNKIYKKRLKNEKKRKKLWYLAAIKLNETYKDSDFSKTKFLFHLIFSFEYFFRSLCAFYEPEKVSLLNGLREKNGSNLPLTISFRQKSKAEWKTSSNLTGRCCRRQNHRSIFKFENPFFFCFIFHSARVNQSITFFNGIFSLSWLWMCVISLSFCDMSFMWLLIRRTIPFIPHI